MVCFNKAGSGIFPKPVFRSQPSRCTYTKRGSKPDDADSVRTQGVSWSRWGGSVAIGKGKAAETMVGLVPVKVKLYDTQVKCGGIRVYTKARFKFPDQGGGYTNPLPLYGCT